MVNLMTQHYSYNELTPHEARTIAALVAQIPTGQAHQAGIPELFAKLDSQLRAQDAANAPELGVPAIQREAIAGPTVAQPRSNWGADHAAKKGNQPGIARPARPGKRAAKR